MEVRVKIKEGFVLEQVGNSYLAVAVGDTAKEFSGLVRMNGTGAFLWNLILDADKSREELIEAALAEYDAPRAVIERDVDSFMEKLANAGIAY